MPNTLVHEIPGGVTAPADQRTPPPAPQRRPWRVASLTALTVWLLGVLVQGAVSVLAYLAQGKPLPQHWSIAAQWLQWDAGHYVRIAVEGYGIGPGFPAFFPLYPVLIRYGDAVLPGNAVTSAWIIAHACALGALAVLHRLTEHEFGRRVAQRTTIYLAVFPVGFFMFAPYNTSLFLLLSIGALYAVRRGHWWLAGGLGALASATRLFGVLLAAAMAFEYLRQCRAGQRRPGADLISIALVPLGVAAYMAYCARVLGNPMAFSVAQDQWGRAYTVPGGAWWDAVRHLFDHPVTHLSTVAALLDAGTYAVAVVLLLLCLVGPWKFRRDQLYLVVYSAATLLLLGATEVGGSRPMQSAPRYILEATAVFLVLGRIGVKPLVDRAVLAVGLALQVALATVYLSGTWLVA
jgi:hypothetical protein